MTTQVTSPAPTGRTSGDTPAGLGYALGAYVIWGFLPLYLRLLDHVPAFEIVAHRIIWSVPIAGLLLIVLGRTRDLRAALTSPATLAMGAVTAILISVNWGIYVWSVMSGRALDAALGYYINPLFSVALGAVLLGERPTKVQALAIGIAAVAVGYLTVQAGVVPWAALGMTVSFGFYGFFKKWLPIGPNQGFLLEVLMLLPFAVGYVVWLEVRGTGTFGAGTMSDLMLLIGSGVVTAIPLMLYANGAQRLRLSTIAMLQYVAPTLIFLVAVFFLGEPFGPARMVAFPMIWAALALYSWSLFRKPR